MKLRNQYRRDSRSQGMLRRRAAIGCTAILAIAATAAAAVAQDPADPVGALLDQHHTTGALTEELDGSAGQLLDLALAQSHAFLIGELHLTHEIAVLARVLARAGAEHGYSALAIEVGPVTAELLAARAASGVDSIAGAVREYPFGFPFFNTRPEAELLVEAAEAGYAIQGLDQEFIGSPRILLARLRELAPTDAARALVDAWIDREQVALMRFMQDGDMSAAIMTSATAEEFAQLRATFQEPAALRVVDEMAESAAIYREFRAGENYRSNHHRIGWMKEHLRRYRESARDQGRMLLKFGSVHMGRGYSPLNQLDLGNHMAELAAAQGGESFHLLTMAGRVRNADGTVSEIVGEEHHLWPLLQRTAAEGWTVFDLRPLRPHFHRDSNRAAAPELADAVFRYDAVAMRQQVTAAEEL